ncbi:MAG: MFS transporter, partial [Phocaeicola sp.]|nr:MFS transporter [Phocaeicola sp.]
MFKFLRQPPHRPIQQGPEADTRYKKLRMQVFLGAFIGYAGFYLVRKNLSMAFPAMAPLGFDKTELGFVLGLNAAAYALSKFLMGSVSDRSNARIFLPLGLVLTSISMCFMIVPIQFVGAEHKTLAILLMS